MMNLEVHIQFRCALALLEPQALSPGEYQELTDYGLRHYVQVIPYLDAPAHIAFILKHPEYATLREYPESNYELCVTNPDSYKLLFGMFADLIAANRGVPDYSALSENKLLHPRPSANNEVIDAFGKIAYDSSRQNSDLIGVVVAGWADMGLHPETFWLGYGTATSASRNPSADPRELMSSFYTLYFGPASIRMDRIYQLLSFQAQFWSDSWDTVESKARKPIFGNSYGVFNPPRPAKDQSLPLPSIPFTGDTSNWESNNARRLELAAEFRAPNDELTRLLLENIRHATYNRYALQAFLAINALCRNNLEMIGRLGQINTHLTVASQAKEPPTALRDLDEAPHLLATIPLERNQVLRDSIATWTKAWLPRVEEANGRRFLHEV